MVLRQKTMTSRMLALAIVPLPLMTLQVWLGEAEMVTEYGAPLGSLAPNVKLPLPEMARVSPRLFCSSSPDVVRPVMRPPTVYAGRTMRVRVAGAAAGTPRASVQV